MQINPLTPKRTQMSPFTEISILFYEGTVQHWTTTRGCSISVDVQPIYQRHAQGLRQIQVYTLC